MAKVIYAIMDSKTLKTLFSYRTNQGNVKKAFFSSKKQALEAIDKYIKDGYHTKSGDWVVYELVGMWEEKNENR